VPPRTNLRYFVEQGADLVTISGGKGVRGPQGSGILVGRRDLIRAAATNGFPKHGIGRPIKVSKEEMVGLVTALQVLLARDEAAEYRRWREQAQLIVDSIAGVPGVRASVECDYVTWMYPTVVIFLDKGRPGMTASDVIERLRLGSPPIVIEGEHWVGEDLMVRTMNFTDEETELVGQRLKKALSG